MIENGLFELEAGDLTDITQPVTNETSLKAGQQTDWCEITKYLENMLEGHNEMIEVLNSMLDGPNNPHIQLFQIRIQSQVLPVLEDGQEAANILSRLHNRLPNSVIVALEKYVAEAMKLTLYDGVKEG
jgi:hypothetical protein